MQSSTWRRSVFCGGSGSGSDFERRAVSRTDRAEVPTIQRQQGLDIQPFSDSDDEGVHRPEGEVGVLLNEVRGAKVVSLDRDR